MNKLTKNLRARDLGLLFSGEPGEYNAITDVTGITVGFKTLTDTKKNIRTGVTAIIPLDDENHPSPVLAGHYSLNGNGEMTGTHWINDAGYFIGPVCITNTHSVGMVHHGVTKWMIQRYREYFENEHAWAMPIVAETYDGVLNDINGQHITSDHAIEALNSASTGVVAEGSTGGGNGMICYDFKGGTGTSSRKVEIKDKTYTVGTLVQANHGIRAWLNILGKPVGKLIPEDTLSTKETGSIIVIIATDAPLSPLSLRQIAKRAAIGVGRGGSPGGNSSGDIFLAFSVATKKVMPQKDTVIIENNFLNSEHIDPLYLATVESVEEAVINALVAGEDVKTFKPKGKVCKALDINRLRDIFT
ncbi:MAG: P1 family peptidase [Paracoccaceae bacterium]|jgi:L-aminopeptidase/D-esterase-like protein|nr:P1 family peptidase [Paracoccaceae bacterium]